MLTSELARVWRRTTEPGESFESSGPARSHQSTYESGARVDPEVELDSLTDLVLEPIASLIEAPALRQRLWLSTRSALKNTIALRYQRR